MDTPRLSGYPIDREMIRLSVLERQARQARRARKRAARPPRQWLGWPLG
jgi:hypothetical protein